MIKVLDCTLRDGGRIINCAFKDSYIKEVSSGLAEAKIDIVEIGFLRDCRQMEYLGNSTFFTDVEQIVPFVRKDCNTMYVAFVDFGMYDFSSLKEYDGRSIEGIRVGFTKRDFVQHKDEIIESLVSVKTKGYQLFIQGVNSLAYSEEEMLDVIDMVNEVSPYSFGIVDTYGAMYADDLKAVFDLLDKNLSGDIFLDFHSHNNYQLSFSLSQEMIRLAKDRRNVIIDCTLNGMGKLAGNLNTELLVDYLVRKCNMDYEFNKICDLIDDYIYPYKESCQWGYSIPSLFSGIYQSHPNNVIYLLSKFRLQSKDIKNLLASIEPEERTRYNYDNIEKIYVEYCAANIDDREVLSYLKEKLSGKRILIIVPGGSLQKFEDEICQYTVQGDIFTISVNYVYENADMLFFGNKKRYLRCGERNGIETIVTSNIERDNENDKIVNYYDLINKKYKYFDNSAMMLLYLLRRIGFKKIYLAGFDGFSTGIKNNYIDDSFQNSRHIEEFDSLNNDIMCMLRDYISSIKGKSAIEFITPSVYQQILEETP
jgi:4-hydroxy 2-oxovalerate aldolase